MKLAGFLQIYNEESNGNLRRCLDSLSRYCDIICVYDDCSTDNSADIAMGYNSVHLIRGKINEFDKEIYHKQELLEFTMSFNPDWILWMDADEVVEKRGEDGAIRELCASSSKDAHDFRQVNFWRSERYYRLDGAYNRGIFCRLWRATGGLRYAVDGGLHRKPYPEGISTIKTSDIQILHYGFASDANIVNKYRTYRAHGQSGWDLEQLVDEKGLRLAETPSDWLGREPEGWDLKNIKDAGAVCERAKS